MKKLIRKWLGIPDIEDMKRDARWILFEEMKASISIEEVAKMGNDFWIERLNTEGAEKAVERVVKDEWWLDDLCNRIRNKQIWGQR